MTHLHSSSHRNCLILHDGILPSSKELTKSYPTRIAAPLSLRDMPIEEEARQAWLLSAHAMHYALRRRYDVHRDGPLETWLLRPGVGAGKFAEWFSSAGSEYRVLIHRVGTHAPLERIRHHYADECFRDAYKRIGLRQHRAPIHVSRGMRAFLTEMLLAYETRPEGVSELMAETPHVYCRYGHFIK